MILLRFVAAYCLFDAMCVVFTGTLKGAGDTRFIMIVSLLLTPMPVAAAWVESTVSTSDCSGAGSSSRFGYASPASSTCFDSSRAAGGRCG